MNGARVQLYWRSSSRTEPRKSKGLSYEDFDMIFFNDLLAMGQALINGDVDVSSVVQPYAALVVAEADGAYLGNNETAWGIEAPDCVVTMKQQMVEQKPDIVERYLTAILQADDLMTPIVPLSRAAEAYQELNEHPERGIKLGINHSLED